MVKGTKILFGNEANQYKRIIDTFENVCIDFGFKPIIVSSLEEQETFFNKAGREIADTMYTFKDKGDRDICLIPEVTAVIQKLYNESWAKTEKKPVCVYYTQRCYRYDRPQAGRYREFTQFGIEVLGGQYPQDRELALKVLFECFRKISLNYKYEPLVKRGLSYYVEDGFEIECESLGAQKQIAGGGRYKEGVGWAIGVERIMLALKGE